MKNKELFDRTVAILVKAYQNDTLRHGDCTRCVVGNLCGFSAAWSSVFYTAYGIQDYYPEMFKGRAKKDIEMTGYTVDELKQVEFSFEDAEYGGNDDDYMFNGLMSVIDTLMQIHEATTEETESAKLLFVKS